MHRSALDAADVPNFADDHFIIHINWLNANAMHGIKLRVPREHAETARDILAGASEIGLPEVIGETVEGCPECGAAASVRTQKWLAFFGLGVPFVAAMIGLHEIEGALFVMCAALLVTIIAPGRRCTECGERW